MTGAWRDPDDIKDDFASGDPTRIQLGLAGLREFSKAGDEVDLPAIDASLLKPFGDTPPADVVLDLARLLMSYWSFVPPPSREDVHRELVEIAIRYDASQVAYETSIHIQGAPDPAAAAREAMAYIGSRGLANAREIDAAGKLIGDMLGAKLPVRRAVAEGLAAWPRTAAKRRIIKRVLLLVEADQRAHLARA